MNKLYMFVCRFIKVKDILRFVLMFVLVLNVNIVNK